MNTERTGIGPGLLFILVFSILYGHGLMRTPYLSALYFKSNGYWGVCGAFILALPVICAVVALVRRFPGKSLVAYLPEILGQIVGKIVGILYVLFLFTLTTWNALAISDYLNLYLLPRTPYLVVLFIVILTTLYIASKGIEGISRTASFLFFFSLIFITTGLIVSFQNFSFTRVQPMFLFHWETVPLGLVNLFYAFLPLAVLPMILQYLTQPRKGLTVLLSATGLVGLILYMTTFINIGVFGAKGVIIHNWPFTELGKVVNIPFILQTFGLFISPILLIQVIFGASACYFATAQGIVELTGKLSYKLYLYCLFPIIMIIGSLAQRNILIRTLEPYFRIAGFGITFGLPLLIWILAALLQRGGGADAPH
ncbi:MAG TPA: endospore germination permease [Bacillota bacterium]|nr:endospore germination permease [Bacillota bacterium]